MQAKDLYQGTLFKNSLKYAQSLNPDRIYILSAEHHLLPIDKVIGYYQNTLKGKSAQEKKEWADIVLDQMKQEGLNLQSDECIILAGDNYCKFLQNSLPVSSRPLKGLKLGEQLQKLNQLNNG